VRKKDVRVRFAPSPTGELHIGGGRTALFNWLFARHKRGKFILRIEDTDVVRSRKNFSKAAIENLRWLGLEWDEGPGKKGDFGPYFQSQRLSIYEKYARRLVKEKKAYYCYCTQEELEESKKKMLASGLLPLYNGRCRVLSNKEIERSQKEEKSPSIRFKVPRVGTTYVDDLLRGRVSFANRMLGDFIILKSNKTPAFNFANVVDDAMMKISYVIRGDDHLSNTPRQILLYEALDFKVPQYAHISMILGKDGRKLSKRHGATSISYYREKGYLPWALVNYLALLGWSTVDSQQFFEKEELIEKFSLEKVGKSAAIFDPQKLEWMNGEYIRRMDLEILTDRIHSYLKEGPRKMAAIAQSEQEKYANILQQFTKAPRKMAEIIRLEQKRIKVLSDFTKAADFFFEGFHYDPGTVSKRLNKDYVPLLLKKVKTEINELPSYDAESLEKMARKLAEDLSLSTSKIFHPLRVSLTGRMKGPGLFELAVVLGKKEVLRRIDRTLEMLNQKNRI